MTIPTLSKAWPDVDDPTRDESSDGGEPDSAGRVPFAVFVLFEAALAPIAMALGYLWGRPPLAEFAWDARAALFGALAALPMLAMLVAALKRPVGPLVKIKAFFDQELAPTLRGCRWPDLALISAVAGLGEEMLFRGVIQGALVRPFGPVGAVAAAGAVFGLMHPVSTAYVVIAGALGAYLGAVWLVTGNLLAPMVAHAVYDFVALLVLLRDRPAEREASR